LFGWRGDRAHNVCVPHLKQDAGLSKRIFSGFLLVQVHFIGTFNAVLPHSI